MWCSSASVLLGPVSDGDVLSNSLAFPLRNFIALRHVCACVWFCSEICLNWTLLTEVSSAVSRWTRAAWLAWATWAGIYLTAATGALSQILWWTWCCRLSFHHLLPSFFYFLFDTFIVVWYGCFPQCFLFLVNAKSIFLCLPERQILSAICKRNIQSEEDREAQLQWACYDKLSLTPLRLWKVPAHPRYMCLSASFPVPLFTGQFLMQQRRHNVHLCTYKHTSTNSHRICMYL